MANKAQRLREEGNAFYKEGKLNRGMYVLDHNSFGVLLTKIQRQIRMSQHGIAPNSTRRL